MKLVFESAWKELLALKNSVTRTNAFCEQTIVIGKDTVRIIEGLHDHDGAVYITDKPDRAGFFWKDQNLHASFPESQSNEILNFLMLYLPLCYLSLAADKARRTVTISHFAQTLDGKIATETGSSKWIGNQENLIHAHRMRSLVDGVLVGSKTYFMDRPQLTVRHVAGPNPAKLVIMSNGSMPEDESFLVIKPRHNDCMEHPNIIRVESSGELLSCDSILSGLYQRGIKSLYIEGGAFTTSCFLKSKLIDHLQIHFSNKILGSGKNSFLLSPVAEISESLKLENHQYFQVGDEMMITGNVHYQ